MWVCVTVFLDCFHTFSESWVNFIECSHLLCTARVFSGEWVNYFSLLSHKFLWVLTHFSKQLTHFSEKDTKPYWITRSTHWRHLVAAYWNCSLNSKYRQHLCELSVQNKSSCSQPIKEVNRLKLKSSMDRGQGRFFPRCIAMENINCDVDENMWPDRQTRLDNP